MKVVNLVYKMLLAKQLKFAQLLRDALIAKVGIIYVGLTNIYTNFIAKYISLTCTLLNMTFIIEYVINSPFLFLSVHKLLCAMYRQLSFANSVVIVKTNDS